ncbi:TetR family transcriptional regulator [Mycolicibacterium duvalii]|uniref:Putative transcriptional regulator, TetR family protein n=1 Tax=Mycolicibacterium duvalii TaxID=39688 RepID=A0A7I7K4I2_9MYCO|nr:TetR/AcrR family transcriptional regulator [Mycolicibacterium duvalii]MCV7367091.1 TetR/AcrR family transcriptional regulator [Mycolicibacterium duvalii]PEG42853.1 TetR family transcriptional regulator [Mycolicibacterium duvalii]BBX18359.1 putative transcriptional regulator, TetR family protein [Mycolicibacterium duvalii]
MPRPARYSVDDLLDAAAALLAADGAAAVTMSAVARSCGAPSGSVYHRFPSRAALCGELWLRTEERFVAELLTALAEPGDPQQRCVAAARRVLAWCRDHPAQAQVLLTGAAALGLGEWPETLSNRRKRLQRKQRKAFAELAEDTGRVSAALIDVPLAMVRRAQRPRQTVPPGAEQIVEDCARALIAPS